MKTRIIVVGLIVPLVVIVAAVAVGLSWIPGLPDSIAIHWGGNGEPDGFGTPLGFLLQLAGVSLGLSVLFTGIVSATADTGLATQQKLLVLVSPFISVLLMTIVVISLAGQRGLTDATAAPSPVLALIPGLVLGLAAAVIGWYLLPKARPAEDQDATIPAPTELTSTDRVLWSRSVNAPPPLLVFVGATAVLILVAALVAPSPSPWPWLFTGFVILVLLGSLSWRVRIDNTGVLVRSLVGLPRFRVRLADIDSATVPVVNPLVEFGGWGIRFGAGRRTGIILGGGDALEVHRVNGSSLVVTVSDAEGAASLVNGLVARARLDSKRR